MPEKIKLYIKKGKEIENKLVNNENTYSLINDCINIENSIKSIKYINENLEGKNIDENKIQKFIIDEIEFNYLSEKIKTLSRIFYPYFKFRKCPENIENNRKYNINGEDCNIITRNSRNKTKSKSEYIGIISENELEKEKVEIWRIKVLFSYDKENIVIGVASSQFDINSSMYDDCDCGWYFTWSGKEKYIQKNKEKSKKKKDFNSESDDEREIDSEELENHKEKRKRRVNKKKKYIKRKDSSDSESSSEDEKKKKRKKRKNSLSDSDSDSESEETKKRVPSENGNLSVIDDENERILEMNMKEKKLKLIKKNKEINEINNIEVKDGIYPVVFLGNYNDSVKIEKIFLK